ncbi:MAG: HEAT repeat domain-containing protein [Planctomycetota bacterium]|jgi:HEAT repeat protein
MKKKLPVVSVTLGIIAFFICLLTALMIFPRVRYGLILNRIKSGDNTVSRKGIRALVLDGAKAMPHIREWLKSGNETVIQNLSDVLNEYEDPLWRNALPELSAILKSCPSKSSDIVAALLLGKNFKWKEHYSKDRACRQALNFYIFRNAEYDNDSDEFKYSDNEVYISELAEEIIELDYFKGAGLLMAMLGRELDETRKYAIIWNLGTYPVFEANDSIIHMLETESDDGARAHAAEALGYLRNFSSVDALLNALCHDNSADVRSAAAQALGEIRDDEVMPVLCESLLNDPDNSVRAECAAALGCFGNECAVQPLIDALSDEAPEVRTDAATSLGYLESPDAFVILSELLAREKNRRTIQAIMYAFGRIGNPAAVPQLAGILREPVNYSVRQSAINALERIRDDSAVPVLLWVLENDNEYLVRNHAAVALGHFDAPGIEDALLHAAEYDNKAEVRKCAIYSLGKLGSEKALLLVSGFIGNRSNVEKETILTASIWAAGEMGCLSLMPEILNIVETESEEECLEAAALYLLKTGYPNIVEPITEMLSKVKHVSDKREIINMLGPAGDNSALPLLTRTLLKSDNEVLRSAAAEALGRINDKRAAPFLARAFEQDQSRYVNTIIVRGLGLLKARSCIDRIHGLLESHPDRHMRLAAAYALAEIGDNASVEYLARSLKSDTSKIVRVKSALALASIGGCKSEVALEECSRSDGFPASYVALGWLGHSGHLEKCREISFRSYRYEQLEEFRILALARWGNVCALVKAASDYLKYLYRIPDYGEDGFIVESLYLEVFARLMLKDLEIKPDAAYHEKLRIAGRLEKFLTQNKERLYWDASAVKYCIR